MKLFNILQKLGISINKEYNKISFCSIDRQTLDITHLNVNIDSLESLKNIKFEIDNDSILKEYIFDYEEYYFDSNYIKFELEQNKISFKIKNIYGDERIITLSNSNFLKTFNVETNFDNITEINIQFN